MSEKILLHYLQEFRSGRDVSPGDVEVLFDALITEQSETHLADLLAAWNEKGTTEDELFAFASIMRNRMKRLVSQHQTLVDIVGTGGSKTKTFNVSTAAAFVIAGTGLSVAKHGNRAATSKSGSSDVLSQLGIDVDIDAEITESHLNDHGMCFMFAPRFHSLSPTLANARRSIGRPTIFNNLGPLCNPASAPHQVIGVWHRDLIETTANVLSRLGTKRSWIVHGQNGLDEIALTGKTFVAEIDGDAVKTFEITAADFGINSVAGDLPLNCSAQESSALIRRILDNESKNEDAEKLVCINAAAAIFIAGCSTSLTEAYEMSEASIRSGAALDKLNMLRGNRENECNLPR